MLRPLICLILLSVTVGAHAQLNMSFVGHLPYNDELNDVWGYVDGSGNEYALVGTVNGFSIVDVTDPSDPQQLHYIPGVNSTWRDMKVWADHAYVVNETSGGMLIVDLSNLPGSISSITYTAASTIGGPDTLSTAHNIFIDENGFAYLFGYNNSFGTIPTAERGALILDLADPEVPVIVGMYKTNYIHDGFVRGDTLWGGEIYNGNLSVVDVSDKANPQVLALQSTPTNFTHNCWLSDDGQTVYTTDERSGAYVAAYDVSDLENISELDRYQSSPGSGVIPHNTFVFGNYLITSYYKDGVTVVDATDPSSLVEVGNYDTSPFLSEEGFGGCWGVYPYLPSGNIIATDTEEGLFVLSANYVRACYLQGTVTSSVAGGAISGTRIEFIGTGDFKFSAANGDYKTGIATPGNYDVRFYKPGCQTQIVTDVAMVAGQVTDLDIDLDCSLSVSILDPQDEMLQFEMISSSQLYYYNNTGYTDIATIRMYTLSGQLYKEWQIETPEAIVTLGGESNGIYIAELIVGDQHRTLKIMQNH